MKKRGFTVIELLIVICIVGILAGLFIPAIDATIKRNKAQEQKVQSQPVTLALEKNDMPEVNMEEITKTVKIDTPNHTVTIIDEQITGVIFNGTTIRVDKSNGNMTISVN